MSAGGLLLERDLEVEVLAAALAAAEHGTGQVLIVGGPAGIGKTRLLEVARGLARASGFRVLGARGSELEREFPYGMARQLYEPVLATASREERERWLGGAAGLVPSVTPESAGVSPADSEGTFARLHGLYWLFANIAADGPLLVLVDDAQWADDPSLRFLGFLARRAGELRLSLVVGTRPGQPGGQPLLRELIGDPVAVKLRPAPLSADAVAAWIAADTGEEADAVFGEACREVTSGYPFFVRELLHEIRTEQLPLRADAAARVRELGPEGVVSVVLVRLARLSPAAGELARALAVLGDGADLRAAARLAMLGEQDPGPMLDSLAAADVLVPGQPVRFVHPIICAAILADLAPGYLAAQHARAARLLHEDGAPLEQVAAHLLAAGPTNAGWTVPALRAAATEALSAGGTETAATYLRRAVAATPRGESAPVLAELGQAEALAGNPGGIEHLREAIELASDPLTAARIRLTLGRALKYDQPLQACDVLERANTDARSDSSLVELLETELLSLAYLSASARRRLESRLGGLRDPGGLPSSPHETMVLAALAADTAWAAEPVERSVSLARRVLSAATRSEPHEDFVAFLVAAPVLAVCDCFDEAETAFAELREVARRQGWLAGYLTTVILHSMMEYRRGALREAEADVSEVLTRASEVDDPRVVAWWAETSHTCIALERGDKNELGALARRAGVAPISDAPPWTRALHTRGLLRAAIGDERGGLADLLAAGEQGQRWNCANPAISWWRSDAALILMRLGELKRARDLADEELELARKFGARRALGIALRAAALTRGRAADLKLLEESDEVLRTSGAELEHARALTDLGAAIRRAGRPAKARDPLRRGHELAGRCGATALAERAMRELLAAGARPRRTALSGVESLTPSQLRVAELAAEGMTNREIAQALFVTEKTVETHLGQVYPKLDVSSRTELPARLEPANRHRASAGSGGGRLVSNRI